MIRAEWWETEQGKQISLRAQRAILSLIYSTNKTWSWSLGLQMNQTLSLCSRSSQSSEFFHLSFIPVALTLTLVDAAKLHLRL